MNKLTILASSCDRYQQWWNPWRESFNRHWSDCSYPRKIISNKIIGQDLLEVGEDLGWNRMLKTALTKVDSEYILLTLENHLLWSKPEGFEKVIEILDQDPTIGIIQLSKCWPTEIDYPVWPVLGEYSREHHPFKACSLSATAIWRKTLLFEMVNRLIDTIPEKQDQGRQGAVEFEVEGTKYWTANVDGKYQWRILGINRYGAGGEGIYRFENASY